MNSTNHDLSQVPSKEALQEMAAKQQLRLKERAITAGLVVELEPDEADALGISAFDILPPDNVQLEQDLLDSRFDPCEFDLENYKLED